MLTFKGLVNQSRDSKIKLKKLVSYLVCYFYQKLSSSQDFLRQNGMLFDAYSCYGTVIIIKL